MPGEPRSRGGDRPRDRSGDRDRDRRDRADVGATPHDRDRRNRSRSPRHERGGRRSENKRYRSRSPVHRPDRPHGLRDGPHDVKDHRDRGAQGQGHGRPYDRDNRENRAPPSGPRGRPDGGRPGGAPRGPLGRAADNAPVKPEPEEETKDVKMGNMPDGGPPEGVDEDTWEMMKVMGFGQFKSTKNTKVAGNDKNYAVRRDKVMTARQYMNRQGGFNRPLSPGR